MFLKYWTRARAEVQEAVTAESASTVFVEFLSLSLIMKTALQTVMEVSAYNTTEIGSNPCFAVGVNTVLTYTWCG